MYLIVGFSALAAAGPIRLGEAAAFTQPPGQRRRPRGVNVLGAAGCLILVAALPPYSLVAGLGVAVGMFAVGLVGRLVALRARRARS